MGISWNQHGGVSKSPLPDWLTAGPVPRLAPTIETRELAVAQYESVFARVIERMYEGYTLSNAIKELPIAIDQGGFLKWMKQDPKRVELYKEAKEIRTEAWAGKIIEHATSENGIEDVARSKLIVDTYKWLMGADNRKTYGDTKSIEVSSTISISTALEQARGRVIDQSADSLLLED